MGIEYSNGCLGTSRKKSYGGVYGGMFESWQPEGKTTNILVTPEEAFMIKKQSMLNIHYIPCEKLKTKFCTAFERNATQDLSQGEFSHLLAKSKLLKDDFPMTDERWTRFYSKFIVIEGSSENARYSLVPTLVALIFLAQGNSEEKAAAIGELFSEHHFMQSRNGTISSENRPSQDGRMSGQLRDSVLSRDQLRCILTIFINIALILLPLYASDYPSIDKRGYFKLLV